MPRKRIHENGWDKSPEGLAYHNQFLNDHYARLFVRIPKERREEIDKLAADAGMTVVGFVLDAVDAWKEKHGID